MGTNFYLMTKSKELAHKHFAIENDWGVSDAEYEIVDEPYLGYEIHLNKLSFGWRPLFQRHKAFKTWTELERFCNEYQSEIDIYDEYKKKLDFAEYKERIFDHAAREPEPMKWYYGVDPIQAKWSNSPQKTLYHDRCTPEEAEFWIPIDHVRYKETEAAARQKYKAWNYPIFADINYWNDPEYPIDWTEGDFA